MIYNESLLFSPDTPLPDHALHGFAYDGVDMICGSTGYSKFKARRGRLVKPGQDGSYIVVNRNGAKPSLALILAAIPPCFYIKAAGIGQCPIPF